MLLTHGLKQGHVNSMLSVPSGEIFREVSETPLREPPAFLPTSPSHQTRKGKRSADVPELTPRPRTSAVSTEPEEPAAPPLLLPET